MKTTTTLLIGAALLAACAPPRDTVGLTTRAERLAVLISIDTLRPDRLSLYGAERPTSPHLERLAEDAVVFETAVASAPWTIPSHATMLTSTWPRVHGAGAKTAIAAEVPLVSEILHAAGWQTAAVTEIPFLGFEHGFHRGFDHFDNEPPPEGRDRRGARVTRQRLLDWLATADERPAFLFWHLMDVHGPYAARPPFAGRFRAEAAGASGEDLDGGRLAELGELTYHDYLELDRFASLDDLVATYDEAIAEVDQALGEFFDLLRRAGLYDDALIVVTSDHGESFDDHGVWVGHGLFLTDDEIRVPLVVKLPGNAHAGTRVREMVRLLDVAPSILDALGVPRPASFQGLSLVSPAPGRPESLPEIAFGFSSGSGADFVRTRHAKYISAATPDRILFTLAPRDGADFAAAPLERAQLYDLRRDPGETSPLDGPEAAERTAALGELIRRHAEAAAARRAGGSPEASAELSAEARKRLRALGYLD